jgi:hypothetical protein
MTATIEIFSQYLAVRYNTTSVVDHRQVVNLGEDVTIKAVVQKARPRDLQVGDVDTSLRYIYVHTLDVGTTLTLGDGCTHNNVKYLCVGVENDGDYGFLQLLFEENI